MARIKKIAGKLLRPLAFHVFLLNKDTIQNMPSTDFIAEGVSCQNVFQGESCFLTSQSRRELEVTLKFSCFTRSWIKRPQKSSSSFLQVPQYIFSSKTVPKNPSVLLVASYSPCPRGPHSRNGRSWLLNLVDIHLGLFRACEVVWALLGLLVSLALTLVAKVFGERFCG